MSVHKQDNLVEYQLTSERHKAEVYQERVKVKYRPSSYNASNLDIIDAGGNYLMVYLFQIDDYIELLKQAKEHLLTLGADTGEI